MGALHAVRTSPGFPFTHTGTYYFGPFHVKIGRRVEKGWGVIYTFLATRAVHLDKAYSMTQDSFINSLRRFEPAQGRPVEIWCDNGSNLKAVHYEALQQWNAEVLEQYISAQGGTRHEIRFLSSWVGGPWERLIGSCKIAMKAVLGN